MKTTKETFQEQIKEKSKRLKAEPYQVVVLLKFMPNPCRITYSNSKSNKVTKIEELDSLELIKTSCTFRGRSHTGQCSEDIIELKVLAQQLKPSDWVGNECWIDSYYLNH